jgi:OFA family oxalate/formate antiporter-like MFS transporter
VLSAGAYGYPAKRIAILPAVLLIQTCLGGVYAWSAFVPFLTADYGLSMSRAQSVFGMAILTFTIAMVVAGRLLTRWGPRRVALMGALLFTGGHMITAGAGGRFSWLIGGYGLTVGAGIGFGYVAALTSGLRWFPQRKGAVTGVAVAGFGLGGLVLASLIEKWMRDEWTVPEMFCAIGWSYGAVLALGALLLFRPPGLAADGAPNVVAGMRFLKSKGFRGLAPGMFCGTFAGLLVIGLLKPMGLADGLSPEETTRAIAGLAAGNVAGRIVWGWLYDRIGYRTITAALVLLCLAIGGLMAAGFSPATFIAAGSLVGFGFGACFVLYAAQVAATHGVDQVGRLYPFLFLSYGIAGIAGPFLGGLLHDWTDCYSASLALAALVAALGAWLTWRPPACGSEPAAPAR